uniref:Uncharacterized protein n=1 Tax=viral metagenome TaxID=1070528 RepID=A0A6C0BW56_9ZZZZ
MPAGKSANKHHALEEWKAKMRLTLRMIPARCQLCQTSWPPRAWWGRDVEPPTITMRLIQQKFNWNNVLVKFWEPKYRRWVFPATPRLPVSCDTEGILSATTYVREYYTGGGRAIGEIK